MSELLAFLAARLDEYEAAAKATAPSGTRLAWKTDVQVDDDGRVVGHCVISWPDVAGVAGAWGLERGTGSAVAEHIALHDPARVLREVEAKRKILAMYLDAVAEADPEVVEWMLAVVRTEASVYGDHPDFDPSWQSDHQRGGSL